MKNTVKMKADSNVVRGEFGRGILAQATRAFHRVRAVIERKKAIRHLNSLSDRMLRDIGVERYQIHELVRARGTLTQLAAQPAHQPTNQPDAAAGLRRAA
ncbi:DUF1127 domain-containing protein [Candidatus Spongiihabitans sp.]|uniref:DUF1127 domain-containing protein n=1 Tax=Candidatus Spongiihabitans sp. TaxID=3101308 RepID=UPI003C79D5B7